MLVVADDKRTCLHLAASEGNLPIVRTILSMHADVNPKDRWGNTPLTDAYHGNHSEVAKFLKGRGGKEEIKTLTEEVIHSCSKGDVESLRALVARFFLASSAPPACWKSAASFASTASTRPCRCRRPPRSSCAAGPSCPHALTHELNQALVLVYTGDDGGRGRTGAHR